MKSRTWIAFVGGLVTALSITPAASAQARVWCAPELEALSEGMCFYRPAQAAESEHPVLVLFLHSLVAVKSDWQWEQQRVLMSAAERHGFSLLMPRGRAGVGPRSAGDVWAWPTSAAKQAEVESELVDEWLRARAQIEARNGRPFERLFVFGFSNGAYYASTLALRNRVAADGYGVFAGGSGGKYASILGSRTSERAPIFIGYGTKDPAWHDMVSLADTLKKLGWRHRVKAEPVGHLVTETQLAAAMRFLGEHALAPARSK
ncbi:MAG TPA: hypothetical protein VFQ61_26000 [Polyangiaceae bacterium]|nr:hypothetical protein [Polyangiaceae bacterium]